MVHPSLSLGSSLDLDQEEETATKPLFERRSLPMPMPMPITIMRGPCLGGAAARIATRSEARARSLAHSPQSLSVAQTVTEREQPHAGLGR
mmetsp:Transcript_46180/g.99744  ORF Transcript_46180/g.99744 Transcript_46180/m.99744 type:complete len:91 (-) Transcript_46180:215-487(-)